MTGVIGAGAFGTALAVSLALGGRKVVLWARDAEAVARMNDTRENPRLPGVTLPESLVVTDDIGSLSGDFPLLLAVPMQKLRDAIRAHA
ncbi:MAG: 2-dehydropantoate 2-reductase N-terminal domain-containing protein, partial [Pseudooceanicola nanhaiensis]